MGGDAAAASRENMLVARLSAAFTRLAGHQGQGGNSAERVSITVV